jgi:hypothetical protein
MPRIAQTTKDAIAQSIIARNLAAKQLEILSETLEKRPPNDPQALRELSSAIHSAAKAFDIACERIRILKGVPLPGSKKHEPRRNKRPGETIAFPVLPQSEPESAGNA